MPDRGPHFDTPPELWMKLKPLAREMRHEPTPAENKLWQRLRGRRVQQAKFRRQYAIARFIADFCCLEVRLIVEVDGVIHDYTPEEDAVRQEFLEHQEFHVIRFTNGEVILSLDAVIERIGETILELRDR